MKCIKFNDGHIKRVSENIAYLAVKNGDANYVSKTEWKKYIYGVKKTKPEEVVEEPKNKVSKAEKQKEKRKQYEAEKKKMLQHKKKK